MEVDKEELAEDRTLGKPVEEEPTVELMEGGTRVKPWGMVWVEAVDRLMEVDTQMEPKAQGDGAGLEGLGGAVGLQDQGGAGGLEDRVSVVGSENQGGAAGKKESSGAEGSEG